MPLAAVYPALSPRRSRGPFLRQPPITEISPMEMTATMTVRTILCVALVGASSRLWRRVTRTVVLDSIPNVIPRNLLRKRTFYVEKKS